MESPEFSKIIRAADRASKTGKPECVVIGVNHLYFYFYPGKTVEIERRLPYHVLLLTMAENLPGGNWTVRTVKQYNGLPVSPIIATFKIRNDALWFIYSLLKYRIHREKVGMLKKLWRSIRRKIWKT